MSVHNQQAFQPITTIGLSTSSSLVLTSTSSQIPVSSIKSNASDRVLTSLDVDEAQLYQNRFNFNGAMVISHEQHEANSQSNSAVDTIADVSIELRIFFPAITNDDIAELLDLYLESDYISPGLRSADMKQSLDLTVHNCALTRALNNQTWNAMVALDTATHGPDQSYYWYSTYSLSLSSSLSSSSGSSSGNMSGSSSVFAASGRSSAAVQGTDGSSAAMLTGSSSSSSGGPSSGGSGGGMGGSGVRVRGFGIWTATDI
jgi:hypothetical protein